MPNLPLPLLARGKVRELYEVHAEHLLLVASDRLSAYDVVLPTEVPDKGAVLIGLSVWWFEQLAVCRPERYLERLAPVFDRVGGVELAGTGPVWLS